MLPTHFPTLKISSPILLILLLTHLPPSTRSDLTLVSSRTAKTNELSMALLEDVCWNEPHLCHEKAFDGNGDCFGHSLKAQLLATKCKCSCDLALHMRIQKCCLAVGRKEMKFCLPLCGYNTTVAELGSTLGMKCISQLTTWTYCAADANDNSECCKLKGVTEQCLSFCKGDVPTCDLQSIFSYQPCLAQMPSILQCQAVGLQAQPRFDPKWKARCDWE